MARLSKNRQASDWRRHFFQRKESLRTTWKLRLALLLMIGLIALATRGFWTVRIGRSLICEETTSASDGLLVENFDPEYLVFERAEMLRRAGVSARIFVPVLAFAQEKTEEKTPSPVQLGITELLVRLAHIPEIEVIPVEQVEPISLNAAIQIREFLTSKHVRSVVVVSPDFRSRRSFLVYSTVFSGAGIQVGCVPVFGTINPDNWTRTWHGIQGVIEQFIKLQYYRFYVLW